MAGVSPADLVPDMRPHKRATVALPVDEVAALITARRHHHKREKLDEALPISTIAC
jgi:hypothetical protein